MPLIDVDSWEESPSEWRGWQEYHAGTRQLGDIGWELSFATPELAHSPLLSDVKVFAVRFDAGREGPEPPPQYAPLFAHVISQLTGEGLAACIHADSRIQYPVHVSSGKVTYVKGCLSTWMVNHDLMPRGLWHVSLIVPAPKPFWAGGGPAFFFECPPDFVPHFFQEYLGAIRSNTMEGYILPRKAMPLLVEWNLRRRSAELFDEVMDTAFAAFTTFGDNTGILVVTRKMDFPAFEQCIRLDHLRHLATSMSADELQPYWEMLEKLDEFAYYQSVGMLGRLWCEMEACLGTVETHDPAWKQRFQEGWSQLEQAYRTPLYSSTQDWGDGRIYTQDTMDLERIFAALNNLREMIRSQIRLIQERG